MSLLLETLNAFSFYVSNNRLNFPVQHKKLPVRQDYFSRLFGLIHLCCKYEINESK